eukprot:7385705-Prymnesium_polylepis.1
MTRGRHRFDARCTLITRSPCRRALCRRVRCAVAAQQPTSDKLRTRQNGRTVSRGKQALKKSVKNKIPAT